MGLNSPAAAESEDLTIGSSLENEQEIDWSERDNRRSHPAGSSFEQENPARRLEPRQAEESTEIEVYIDGDRRLSNQKLSTSVGDSGEAR